jgi:hypothetical protein
MDPLKKVFLCWSKDRSEAIAQAWFTLLPEIINCKPILSTEFQKGLEWSTALRNDLNEAKTGIVFLTPENATLPWIHFEAGALATAMGSRNGEVFTYILGLDPGKLVGPLSAYQSTVATKEDTRRLVRDLCTVMECRPPIEEVYTRWWTKLEAALEEIPPPSIIELVPEFAALFDRKTFQEPLPDCTNQRWLDRFAAARGAHIALREAAPLVNDLGRPGARRLYADLITAVDGYAMAMSGFLVVEKRFRFDDQGKLAAPAGAIKACEQRRKRVNDLVAMLADPKSDTPVFEEAVGFADSESEYRKSLIHRWEARLEGKQALPIKGKWLAIALRSEYDYDRIAAYLYQEKRNPPDAAAALAAVWREYEKRRIHKDGSYMPLHYSLRALSASPGLKTARNEIESKLRIVSDFLIKTAGKKEDDPLFNPIANIRAAMTAPPSERGALALFRGLVGGRSRLTPPERKFLRKT